MKTLIIIFLLTSSTFAGQFTSSYDKFKNISKSTVILNGGTTFTYISEGQEPNHKGKVLAYCDPSKSDAIILYDNQRLPLVNRKFNKEQLVDISVLTAITDAKSVEMALYVGEEQTDIITYDASDRQALLNLLSAISKVENADNKTPEMLSRQDYLQKFKRVLIVCDPTDADTKAMLECVNKNIQALEVNQTFNVVLCGDGPKLSAMSFDDLIEANKKNITIASDFIEGINKDAKSKLVSQLSFGIGMNPDLIMIFMNGDTLDPQTTSMLARSNKDGAITVNIFSGKNSYKETK